MTQDATRARKLPPWTSAEREAMASAIHALADSLVEHIQRPAGEDPGAFWAGVHDDIVASCLSVAWQSTGEAYTSRDAAAAEFLRTRHADVAAEVIEWVRLADRGEPRSFYALLHELLVASLTYRVAYPVRQGLRTDGTLDTVPFCVEIQWETGRGAFVPVVPDEDPASVNRSRRAYLLDAIDTEDAALHRLTAAQRADVERLARVPDGELTEAHTDEAETVLEALTESYRLFATPAGRESLMRFLRGTARRAATKLLAELPGHPDAALFREVLAAADVDLDAATCNRVHRARMEASA